MRLSELQGQYEQYIAKEREIETLWSCRSLHPALIGCCDSVPLMIPALKYYQKKPVHLDLPFRPFRLLCRYAPAIFERPYLDVCLVLLESERSLKKESHDYSLELSDAYSKLDIARSLWHFLENHETFTVQELVASCSGHEVLAQDILDVWQELGITVCDSTTMSIRFRTDLSSTTSGKCYQCGLAGKGRREHLYKPVRCTRCDREVYFHLVSEQ